ncbi:MAG: DUF2330 domain-containing protein [Planctomycetota bacterium]|jgi:hypothetical protein
MKAIPWFALLFSAVGIMGGRADADGKFYGEKIPPDIPYQRGFILFHEGSETLVLQSKYEFSQTTDANSLGWIVPVPSVPEIASADAGAAYKFFYEVSMTTRPKVLRISRYVALMAMVFFVGCVAFALFLLLEYPFLNKIGLSKSTWWKRLINTVIAGAITFLLTAMPIRYVAGYTDVEVIKAERAGIYDVKVVRSQSAEGILGWLKENGFGFSDRDAQVFENYVNRNWCFVVAKVQPKPGTQKHKIVAEKMVAPLILRFKNERAIYPLALTSTIGAPTEVLLYTLSEKKLTCGRRLTLRCATRTNDRNLFANLAGNDDTQAVALFADVPKSATLCKFKKRLKPQEMKEDIVFDFAPDNESHRETKVVW